MNEQGSLGSMVDKVMVSILISTNDCSKLIDGAINSKCVLLANDRVKILSSSLTYFADVSAGLACRVTPKAI